MTPSSFASGDFRPAAASNLVLSPDVAFSEWNNVQIPKKKQKKRKIFPRNHSSLGHASRLISIYANELRRAPATDQSEATADETLSNQKTRDAPKLRTTLSLDAQYPMQSGDDANANFMQISTWFRTGRAPDVPESRPLTAHTVTKLRPSVAP